MKAPFCTCHKEFVWGLVLKQTKKDASAMLTEEKSKDDVHKDKPAEIIYLHNIWQTNGNI